MDETLTGIGARRRDWQTTLRKLQSGPLAYCADFPEIARRWNDWWRCEGTRPLMVALATRPSQIRWDKAFDLLDQPAEWLRVRRAQMEQTHRAGEALPSVRVDIGPVSMAAFMGAPLHFAAAEQTSWQDPIIDSWEGAPRLAVDPDNPWLRKVLRLMETLAEDARGRYLVCLPDLTGAIDALANLRSPQSLCFDLHEHRAEILAAARQAVDAWETVFTRMYDLVLGRGAGITQWVTCWSDEPFTVPTCDFNALIGPGDFQEVCMPSLKDQARRAGRCVLHVDGPDAARHAEALAGDPDIVAIQYTPGSGTPSALAKLPMFRMFQQHRVPLFIECPREEVKELAETLDPAGLAIRVGLPSPEEADALIRWRDERFR